MLEKPGAEMPILDKELRQTSARGLVVPIVSIDPANPCPETFGRDREARLEYPDREAPNQIGEFGSRRLTCITDQRSSTRSKLV